jgi:ribosome-associated toxin RatA of RatAB toxin-antitoxin module
VDTRSAVRHRARVEVPMLAWLTLSSALAGAPSATLLDDGTVVGTASVTTAPAEVIRLVADPRWITSIDGGGTQVTVTGREGACLLADYFSPSAFLDVTYTVRQCPTAAGNVSTMVTSNAFHSYRTEWTITPEGAGARITYRLQLDSKLWVPESVVTSTVKKSVERMMQRLADKLGRAP